MQWQRSGIKANKAHSQADLERFLIKGGEQDLPHTSESGRCVEKILQEKDRNNIVIPELIIYVMLYERGLTAAISLNPRLKTLMMTTPMPALANAVSSVRLWALARR